LTKVLFDTSVLVPFLRKGVYLEEITRLARGHVLYFSSVVAQELYAGSRDRRFLWQMDKLYYRFQKVGRLVVPGVADWRAAGLALNRIGRRYGIDRIRRAALVNDALIAASCRREGALLLTLNERDFRRLKEAIDFEFRVP
jgi:predicted nucleic acid-binding protein